MPDKIIECLEKDRKGCDFALPFGGTYFCECPLRLYIRREFHKLKPVRSRTASRCVKKENSINLSKKLGTRCLILDARYSKLVIPARDPWSLSRKAKDAGAE